MPFVFFLYKQFMFIFYFQNINMHVYSPVCSISQEEIKRRIVAPQRLTDLLKHKCSWIGVCFVRWNRCINRDRMQMANSSQNHDVAIYNLFSFLFPSPAVFLSYLISRTMYLLCDNFDFTPQLLSLTKTEHNFQITLHLSM